MKILIPTNDNITIAPEFENAKTFRLLTITDRIIIDDALITVVEDMKDKYAFGLKELSVDTKTQSKNKLTQKIAFASTISKDAEKNLMKLNYKLFKTDEKDIINAVTFYVNKYAVMECDYCCCP